MTRYEWLLFLHIASGLAFFAAYTIVSVVLVAGRRTASAVNAQGAALAGLKRYAEAEKLLLESHAVLHRDSAALRYFVKSSDRWLADFYKATGQPEKAAKFLAQAAREG